MEEILGVSEAKTIISFHNNNLLNFTKLSTMNNIHCFQIGDETNKIDVYIVIGLSPGSKQDIKKNRTDRKF